MEDDKTSAIDAATFRRMLAEQEEGIARARVLLCEAEGALERLAISELRGHTVTAHESLLALGRRVAARRSLDCAERNYGSNVMFYAERFASGEA